jgi:ankyrin repeat protein
MDPREQHSDERIQNSPRKAPPESLQSGATDPAVLAKLSSRLLSFARESRLNSRGGQKLLSEIERLPLHEDRAHVINSIATFGLEGRGVLALHRERMSEGLLHRLMNLGLDLSQRFPINIEERGARSQLVQGANIYHLAALEGDNTLLEMLPPRRDLFDARTASGETPLLLAFKYGSDTKALRETMKWFLKCEADIAARDDSDRQLFHYALQYPGSNVLESLLTAWRERGIIPVNRYEAQTGLALALLSPLFLTRRSVDKLERLVRSAKEAPQGEGAAVSGLLESLDDLVPRRDHGSNQNATLQRGGLSKQATSFRDAIERLISCQHVLGEDVVQFLTESMLPSSDLPLLPTVYQAEGSVDVLRAVVNLGARLSIRFDSGGSSPIEVHGGTLLHHALNDDRLDVVDMTLERDPQVVKIVDSDGNTPIMTHLRACSMWDVTDVPNTDLIRTLLADGCPVEELNSSGKRAIDYAVEVGCLKTISLLARYGAAPTAPDANKMFEIRTLRGLERTVDFKELLHQAAKWRSKIVRFHDDEMANDLVADSKRILQQTKSVYAAYLSLVAGAEVLVTGSRARKKPEMGLSLLKLSRSLLFHLPPQSLYGTWNAIELMSDRNSSIRHSRRHFNEAEMMLLLNHPREQGFNPEKLNPLTRALTATTRVVDAGIDVVRQPVIWNFARIGLYTHGFHLLLKHEAEASCTYDRKGGWQDAGPSLIEDRLGMIRIPSRPHTERICGPGYLRLASSADSIKARLLRRGAYGKQETDRSTSQYQWYSLDSQTMMEFRRGYLLVSNPQHGTLVIRNSSKEFGRSILRNVAYWTSRGYRNKYSYLDLIDITPGRIQREMRNVMHAQVVKSSGAVESIYFLLRQLDVIRDYNRRQKFETFGSDAFVRNPQTKRVELAEFGGYRSPGFRQIVDFLERRFEGLTLEMESTGKVSKILPALAFALPWYPAWVTHKFEGEPGVMRSQLRINEEVLEVLRAFADESFTRRIMHLDDRYGVTRFFREAGFETEGELMLVTPKEEPHTIGS